MNAVTALLHHVNVDTLSTAFYALKRKAAPGVDGVTWQDYEADLGRNLEDLHGRVHRGAYRPQPSRRTYIPKADGRQRPLAIAALEDKIVQGACAMVLNAIYEEDFLGLSYGFRPGRGPHDALDALSVAITSRKVNHILDADVRDFFGSVNHHWMIRFLEHRIGDKRIIRLIRKWLKAGILEDGVVIVADSGTGQGSVISPLLGTSTCTRYSISGLNAGDGRRPCPNRACPDLCGGCPVMGIPTAMLDPQRTFPRLRPGCGIGRLHVGRRRGRLCKRDLNHFLTISLS